MRSHTAFCCRVYGVLDFESQIQLRDSSQDFPLRNLWEILLECQKSNFHHHFYSKFVVLIKNLRQIITFECYVKPIRWWVLANPNNFFSLFLPCNYEKPIKSWKLPRAFPLLSHIFRILQNPEPSWYYYCTTEEKDPNRHKVR